LETEAIGYENYMKIHLREIGCQACEVIDLTQSVLPSSLALHIPYGAPDNYVSHEISQEWINIF